MGNSSSRGWYWNGGLPHADFSGRSIAISCRLADSLPRDVIQRIDTEVSLLPFADRAQEQRRRVEMWLDKGLGSCLLRLPEAAGIVEENWRYFDESRYDLIAWVIMPNHVHVMVRLKEGNLLGDVVKSWKGYTSRRIGSLGLQQDRKIWMPDYFDRLIRNEKHFRSAINYIHNNPVLAGLSASPEEWPWTSAREDSRRWQLEIGSE